MAIVKGAPQLITAQHTTEDALITARTPDLGFRHAPAHHRIHSTLIAKRVPQLIIVYLTMADAINLVLTQDRD